MFSFVALAYYLLTRNQRSITFAQIFSKALLDGTFLLGVQSGMLSLPSFAQDLFDHVFLKSLEVVTCLLQNHLEALWKCWEIVVVSYFEVLLTHVHILHLVVRVESISKDGLWGHILESQLLFSSFSLFSEFVEGSEASFLTEEGLFD